MQTCENGKTPRATPVPTNRTVNQLVTPQEISRVLEAALLCSKQPLSLREMRTLFNDEVPVASLRESLAALQLDWEGRGVQLVSVATGWRFQSRPELREILARINPQPLRRTTRAAQEIMAIIAYRQPVTRGDIEEIRGVTVSGEILHMLEDRGWIEVIGHRESQGRPALLATTRHFLDDLGLSSLEELPPLESSSFEQAGLDFATQLPGLAALEGGAL